MHPIVELLCLCVFVRIDVIISAVMMSMCVAGWVMLVIVVTLTRIVVVCDDNVDHCGDVCA